MDGWKIHDCAEGVEICRYHRGITCLQLVLIATITHQYLHHYHPSPHCQHCISAADTAVIAAISSSSTGSMASQRPIVLITSPRVLLLLLLISQSQPLGARRLDANLREAGVEDAMAIGPARPELYLNEAPTRPVDGSGDRRRRSPLLVSASK